jgi:hypothetical protein
MEAIKSRYIKAWKDYPFHSLHRTHQLNQTQDTNTTNIWNSNATWTTSQKILAIPRCLENSFFTNRTVHWLILENLVWVGWEIKFETTAGMPKNLKYSHSLSTSTRVELEFWLYLSTDVMYRLKVIFFCNRRQQLYAEVTSSYGKILVNYLRWTSIALEVSTIIHSLFKFSTSHKINILISGSIITLSFLKKQVFFTQTNKSLNTTFKAWTMR